MRETERVQKFLASAGVASRRKAEELILQGRVKVNREVVRELGTKVDPARDLVTVDGALVSKRDERTYLLLYKPSGCLTTVKDPQGRPTALDYVSGVRARVFPVGRLDWDAEGAILLTDDGELANRLAHPRYGHRRTYLVKVKGTPAPEQLERIRSGVRLEDGPAHALDIALDEEAEKNTWIRLAVGEGRHHLVKRLCEAVGLEVLRLFRPEFGGVTVHGLRPGAWRALTPAEVRGMRQRVGLVPGEPPPLPRELPRAARRHGHGAPEPGEDGAPPRTDRPREDRPPREDGQSRDGGPREDGERDDRRHRSERPPRGDDASREDRRPRSDRPRREERPRGEDRRGREKGPPRADRRAGPERPRAAPRARTPGQGPVRGEGRGPRGGRKR